ncbi:unnamed protein product, partial [Trichobilharzia regenti]
MCEEIQPRPADLELFNACYSGDFEKVVKLVEEEDADICYQDSMIKFLIYLFQDFKTGVSPLMIAAGIGHTDIVNYLLSEGAPWNAVDRKYLCAGDYAAKNGHQLCIDAILNHAVMSEFLLSLAVDKSESLSLENIDSMNYSRVVENRTEKTEQLNAAYLASRLEYTEDGKCLVDTNTQLAVMMDWETPIMKKHAAWICHADVVDNKPPLNILNVGFGMGIVDTAIQKYSPHSHVIIEAHPEA